MSRDSKAQAIGDHDGPPTVGIVGGGQLGRMLVSSAQRLGLNVRVFQTIRSGPVDAAAEVFTAPWSDLETLREFASACDVVTLEHEWADMEALEAVLPDGAALWPSPRTMALIRDKSLQKLHARKAGIALGPFARCESPNQVEAFARRHGYPVMLKRPTHAYDGYGNSRVDDSDGIAAAYERLATDGAVLVEAWVPYRRELAVMVARAESGEKVVYPVCETIQRDSQCVEVRVPAPGNPMLMARASELASNATDAFGCVGVVGVEMFELDDGRILLNELAPRPHNSGHYTLDACVTSQFENHLRAVIGFPLGAADLLGDAAVMVNVVGKRSGPSSSVSLPSALAVRGAAVHVYGKREVRPGRKMGHVTAVGADLGEARARANEAARRLEF